MCSGYGKRAVESHMDAASGAALAGPDPGAEVEK